jgi:trimethylamine:corrinoid methyltransferase-like protein
MALRLARGIEKRPGDAAELIGELVRGGQFLSHPHTRKNWRAELSVASSLLDRDTYGDWLAAGAKSAAERARDEVARRLAEAKVPPLPPATEAALDAIMLDQGRRAGLSALPEP